MQAQYKRKTARAQAVKIRRGDGRVVGQVVNGIFKKSVQSSVHFLKIPEAICFDLDVLARARDAGATLAEVFDRESKHTYYAPFEKIWKRGFSVNRNHGAQLGLILSEWTRDGEPPADQQELF